MDPWYVQQATALTDADPAIRLVVLRFLGEAARRGPWDLTPLAGLLADLVRADDDAVAAQAALVLRQIAQYRRGSIGAATAALASRLTAAHQELRKEAGAALVEAAENGPGVGDARDLLPPILDHKMKHARQLATDAVAADAVDRMDALALGDLARHARVDVRARALAYLVRGAQWRDTAFAVPLLCALFRDGDLVTRRAAARAMEAALIGPRDSQAPHAAYVPAARAILEVTAGVALPELEPVRAWAERRLTAQADEPRVRELVGALGDPTHDAAIALADVADAARLAYQHDAWPALLRLLRHPDAAVRREALTTVGVDAIGRLRSSTPIAGAVSDALADPDAEVQRAALSALQSLVMFGSATDRTDLRAAHAALAGVATGDGLHAEAAAQLLGLAPALGGLPAPD